ncbi:MAG: class I SAM-dependent methyltransferase [Proteobacteria bacterium]|nr:class I SAM-dependent methyltransferase [Pseudomonadota bacterium]
MAAKSRYNRQSPSPHYAALLEMYAQMHRDGYVQAADGDEVKVEGQKTFAGEQLTKFLDPIKALVVETGARSILDYGAGKGLQYSNAITVNLADGTSVAGVPAFWGVDAVETYEPALGSGAPQGSYDGVVSTDVMEHCFAADVPWIIEEMFSLARRFVFVNVACYPAMARLPNGENAHITIRSPEWWRGVFDAIGHQYPEINWAIACIFKDADGAVHRVDYQRAEFEDRLDSGTTFQR